MVSNLVQRKYLMGLHVVSAVRRRRPEVTQRYGVARETQSG